MSAQPSPQFLDWMNAGDRAGLFDAATIAYYQDSDYLYRVQVNGETITLPVLTATEWLSINGELDDVCGSVLNETLTDVNEQAVRERVERVARGAEAEASDPSDYLYNGAAFTPRVRDPLAPTIDVLSTDYFSKISTDYQFREEFARALYACDVAPTADPETVASHLADSPLPNRTTVTDLPDIIEAIDDYATPFGVNATTIINTGDCYVLLLAHRASNLLVSPDWWNNIPAGGIEPLDTDHPFETNLLKEYAEEVLGADEHDNPLAHPGVAALQSLVETGDAHIDFTSMVVKPDRLEIALNALLIIDDPTYYEQFIASPEWSCFEHADVRLIDVADGAALADVLRPDTFIPAMLPGVFEGLRRAESAYGIPVGLDISRQPLPSLAR